MEIDDPEIEEEGSAPGGAAEDEMEGIMGVSIQNLASGGGGGAAHGGGRRQKVKRLNTPRYRTVV